MVTWHLLLLSFDALCITSSLGFKIEMRRGFWKICTVLQKWKFFIHNISRVSNIIFFHGGEEKVLFPAQKLHFSGIFKVSSTHHELENWRRKMSKKLKMRFSSPLISNGRGLYTAFRTHDCQNQTSYDFFPEARSSME